LEQLIVGELVFSINLPGLTYFPKDELWAGDLQVLGHYNDMPWICYNHAKLYTTEYARKYTMREWGWYPDTPGRFDHVSIAPDNAPNEIASTRVGLFEMSRAANFIVPVMFDLGGVTNLIPDRTDLQLRYFRAAPEFFLMTGAGNLGAYKVKLERAV